MKRLVGKKKGIVVVDVPLLFEKKLQKNFDATIVIACKPAAQLKRIIKRDGWNAPEARRRIAAQLPLAKKVLLADATIRNDRTLSDLNHNVRDYYLGLELIHRGSTHGNADQAHA
jgi:dephospho-CoA kinase